MFYFLLKLIPSFKVSIIQSPFDIRKQQFKCMVTNCILFRHSFSVSLSAPDALKIITEKDHVLLFWKSLALKEKYFQESRVSSSLLSDGQLAGCCAGRAVPSMQRCEGSTRQSVGVGLGAAAVGCYLVSC